MSERHDGPPAGGDHSGGGRQGEHLEGSFTDGGSIPGNRNDEPERSFGAGRGLGGGQEDAGDPQTSESANDGAVEDQDEGGED